MTTSSVLDLNDDCIGIITSFLDFSSLISFLSSCKKLRELYYDWNTWCRNILCHEPGLIVLLSSKYPEEASRYITKDSKCNVTSEEVLYSHTNYEIQTLSLVSKGLQYGYESYGGEIPIELSCDFVFRRPAGSENHREKREENHGERWSEYEQAFTKRRTRRRHG